MLRSIGWGAKEPRPQIVETCLLSVLLKMPEKSEIRSSFGPVSFQKHIINFSERIEGQEFIA